MSRKKHFTATIKGHEWKFFIQTKAAYARKHGTDSEGVTYPREREVYFNAPFFAPAIVRHELVHCYVGSSSTSSSNLTADQVEELCASIYEEHGPEMDLLADKIFNFLRG